MQARPRYLRAGVNASTVGSVVFAGAEPGAVVSSQFLADADEYHRRYFQLNVWRDRIRRALELADFRPAAGTEVLDVGCGSGNTVFAALELFAAANIVACDVSAPLLRILEANLRDHSEWFGRVDLACFDLHAHVLKDAAFDLIQGAAILHHVSEPAIVLQRLAAALRPGGVMVFFEPFEDGCHVLAAMLQQILDRLDAIDHCELWKLLDGVKNDFDHRYGVRRVKPWTQLLDDKWLFTAEFLRDIARMNECRLVAIRPWQLDLSTLYRDYLHELLRASGNGGLAVPPVVWEVAAEFDDGIGAGLKERIAPEMTVVLRREPTSPRA